MGDKTFFATRNENQMEFSESRISDGIGPFGCDSILQGLLELEYDRYSTRNLLPGRDIS
jgi:hypothetical protein